MKERKFPRNKVFLFFSYSVVFHSPENWIFLEISEEEVRHGHFHTLTFLFKVFIISIIYSRRIILSRPEVE